jgi:hypothetical protein
MRIESKAYVFKQIAALDYFAFARLHGYAFRGRVERSKTVRKRVVNKRESRAELSLYDSRVPGARGAEPRNKGFKQAGAQIGVRGNRAPQGRGFFRR